MAADDLGFDPNALREKYRAERDKRLRADASEQYVEIAGKFAHYLEDPYVQPIERAPIDEAVEVVVIGGGFGGQLAAARLREAGVQDIRIIEKGGDFGGTWYWNRYPGAACDIESYIYLPLLEEVGYLPVEKYSRAPEILRHSRAIGEKFDLYKGALFQTEVKELRWDEAAARWTVSTNRGDALRARFVVMANGPLHRPKLPGIPGVESFKGHSFHTSRWDYEYTGGDSNGGLTGLKDKRIGIIGTGATAVQCVPHLGEWAKELYVFQRTPSSIDVRNNRPTDPEWAASLQPGWQQERMDNFNVLVSGGFADKDLVNDGWTDIIGNILLLARKKAEAGEKVENPAELMQLADFKKMEQVRARVDAVVEDPAKAEALKPWYNQFCKRPCFHDEYLTTFNRPNVHLIDTKGRGVERITENAIVVDGKEYEVDCLIYATGFEVGTDYTRRSGYELYGRGGQTLTDKWKNGAETLHGVLSRGFPNCFIVSNVQSGFSANFPHMINEQSKHIAYLVKSAMERQARVVEPSEEAEQAWVDTIVKLAVMREQFLKECTPGYYNNEGKPEAMTAKNGSYGAGPVAFTKVLEDWRAEGSLKGLELTP
ncbi:MAG: monooxygenase [Phenylobacterium sp. RIFCSPHIGHO2_01_FULL_69_31]|uniref:flavin-containing monooxygenase n=1 Tax=Phenylobacterium sp. RIFCSPHIGHO2_01_FULL_69_31 TaxID=1801944 RepID=UPI0008CEE26A|nr:NAD(P)/FAD-dependent oxidoreductase [Phenylobacterium sp. RIFCSPHIGHO2_01_FULL_69_31]OHB27153.1 MAG: monooxygenase [Phenylobacterium sp. RIFCSPHIGHO2_01_FULL_69_31]